MIDGWGASPPETRWLARNRSFRAKDRRADGEAPEPLVDLLRVESEQVAELQVRDPTLCDETTDVPHADVQACSHPVNVEKRLDIGARRAQAKGHARNSALRLSCLLSGLVSCALSGGQVLLRFSGRRGVWCLVLARQDRLVEVSGCLVPTGRTL